MLSYISQRGVPFSHVEKTIDGAFDLFNHVNTSFSSECWRETSLFVCVNMKCNR